MGYKRAKKVVKKILVFTITLLAMTFATTISAQDKMKLYDGVYIVKHGNTYTLEDENTQMCISISVAQEQIDYKNGKAFYEVACNKWTRRVAQEALKYSIEEAFAAAVVNPNAAVAGYVAKAAAWAYEDICDYYGERYNR